MFGSGVLVILFSSADNDKGQKSDHHRYNRCDGSHGLLLLPEELLSQHVHLGRVEHQPAGNTSFSYRSNCSHHRQVCLNMDLNLEKIEKEYDFTTFSSRRIIFVLNMNSVHN